MSFRLRWLFSALVLAWVVVSGRPAIAQGLAMRVVPVGSPVGGFSSVLEVSPGETTEPEAHYVHRTIVARDPAVLAIVDAEQRTEDSDLPTGFPPSLAALACDDCPSTGTAVGASVVVSELVLSSVASFSYPGNSESENLRITYQMISDEPGSQTLLRLAHDEIDILGAPGQVWQTLARDVLRQSFSPPTLVLEDLVVGVTFESTFIRGSCAGSNGPVGLPDVIALLEYTFSGGSVPCADACDFDVSSPLKNSFRPRPRSHFAQPRRRNSGVSPICLRFVGATALIRSPETLARPLGSKAVSRAGC